MTPRVLVLVVALGCGGGKGGGPATSSTTSDGTPTATGSSSNGSAAAEELTGVGVALEVVPDTATVTIDDVMMGKVVELDPVVALAPGLHTLVIAQAGFKSYRVEFSVTDKVEKFVVKLDPAN